MTLYYHDILKMRIDIEDTIKISKNSLIINSSIIHYEKSNYHYETEIRKILNLNILIPINDDSEIITYSYKTKSIDAEYVFEIELPNNSLIINCDRIIVDHKDNSVVQTIINYLEPSPESPLKNNDDNCDCESCHRAEQQKMREEGM